MVALYATFLNRAFDQVLMDAALHRTGITIVLDRAGVTGTDGPSHNGMWDMSLMGIVPGLKLAAPRDQARLNDALDAAVDVDDAVTVIRYSKERLPDEMPAIAHVGEGFDRIDVLRRPADARVLIVAHGQFAGLGLQIAERLDDQGFAATVVDPLWALPVSDNLTRLASDFDLVVTLEGTTWSRRSRPAAPFSLGVSGPRVLNFRDPLTSSDSGFARGGAGLDRAHPAEGDPADSQRHAPDGAGRKIGPTRPLGR